MRYGKARMSLIRAIYYWFVDTKLYSIKWFAWYYDKKATGHFHKEDI